MGGEQLVAAVGGDQVEERLGDRIRAAEKDHSMRLIGEFAAFEVARVLTDDWTTAEDVGAVGVFESVGELRCRLDQQPFDG
jgi:hypothetical protein